MSTTSNRVEVRVRPLERDELDAADRIVRLAFGTWLGLPDPMQMMGDAEFARTRWAADPSAAIAAEVDGELVGSNFLTRWGSVGFFGPLTVLPAFWDKGVARALLAETMSMFDAWGVSHRGLYTFAQSPKHISLYQRFGFLPGYLTPIMARPVTPGTASWDTFSSLPDLGEGLAAAAGVAGSVLEGLDLRREIEATYAQGLGDTVLVHDGDELAAFAVCHVGAGTEAGSGRCYVKFGAARAGAGAGERFSRLLEACEGFAAGREATHIVAGVNTGRRGAYRTMLERGYRAEMIGVAMHRPDSPAYHHPDAYVVDDWR